jgi:hypothetical protein
MRYYRWIMCLCIIMLFASMFCQAQSLINWQFAFLLPGNDSKGPVDTSRPVKLPDGSEFRLYLKPESDVDCYIVYEQADTIASVLFCGEVTAGRAIYLPGRDKVFSVVPPAGTEKIHIIISGCPQKTLETFAAALQEHPRDLSISQKIIDEILRMKQNVSAFTEVSVKPVSTGGTARAFMPGISPDDPVCTEYSGAGLYVKTVRIRH